MACALTSDYTFSCDTATGGIKELYLIELANISSYTESSGTLTAIAKVATKIFRKYKLVLETSHFDEAIIGNRANGTLYYTQTGEIILNNQQVATRNEILLLAKSPLVVVVIDNNGANRLYGRINGLQLTAGAVNSGTAWGDRSGYMLTLTGNETELAPFVTDAAVATLQT